MVQNCLGVPSHQLLDPGMKPSSKTSEPFFFPGPAEDLHFPVGVELTHVDLGDRTAVTSASSSSPVLRRGIMHKAVSARSFVAHVQYDASAAAIAAAVGALEQDVENLWLAGVRTPAKRTVERRAQASKGPSMRFTPQSVLDCPIISVEADAAPASEAEEACRESGLDRGQFADLFREDKEVDQESLEFGNALIERLEGLAGAKRAFPRYQPPARPSRRRSIRSWGLASSSSDALVALKAESSDRLDVETSRTCGFKEKGSHNDLDVRCDGFAVCKIRKGLYRTAQGVSAIEPSTTSEDHAGFYFEVVIVDDKESGGICIGVATDSLAANKLVGSNSESCGLHSSGQIVINNGDFREFGKSFKKGDRVGCMVTVSASVHREDPRAPLPSQTGSCSGSDDDSTELMKELNEEVELRFYVNGENQGSVRAALWHDVPEDKRRLFPVVSLYKKDSKAVMQCCAKDWAMKPNDVDYEVKAFCCNHSRDC